MPIQITQFTCYFIFLANICCYFTHFLPPQYLEIAMQTLSEKLNNEKKENTDILRTKSLEFELIRKDKSLVWIEVRTTFIRDEDNTVTGILGATRDISARKKIESELAGYREHLEIIVEERTIKLLNAKIDAESANTAKSEFLTNMGHELKTPLNSIIGFSDIMMMGYDEDSYSNHIKNVHTSGKHLLKIINNLLNLSNIEAGKIKFEKLPIKPCNLIESCVSIISIKASKKNLTIKNYCEKNKPCIITGDWKRLQQAFLNILFNAVEFTPDNGIIKITTAIKKSYIEINIIDTGVGIKKELQEHIFGQFNQADSGFTREAQGSGLGLAIAKMIIEAQNGKISLKSEEGKGSTFTVSLPVSNKHKTWH